MSSIKEYHKLLELGLTKPKKLELPKLVLSLVLLCMLAPFVLLWMVAWSGPDIEPLRKREWPYL